MNTSPSHSYREPEHRPPFIVVEGPIGVGKTSLAQRLAERFGYHLLLEQPEENPFLERFYAGEKNAALATQLFFLFQRAQQLDQLSQDDLFHSGRVADFLINKDRLFAEVTLDEDELSLYLQVYDRLTVHAPQPDLVVYLQAPASILAERIQKRGWALEQNISSAYLNRINEAYARLFHYYDQAPLLIVNGADIDWVNNAQDFDNLVDYLKGITSGRHYYNPQSPL